MQDGTFGKLENLTPTVSPIIWTTVATGKEPTKHGIEGFVKPVLRRNVLRTPRAQRTAASETRIVENQSRIGIIRAINLAGTARTTLTARADELSPPRLEAWVLRRRT